MIDQLRDIKGIVEIGDISFIVFVSIVSLVAILIVALFVYMFFKVRNRVGDSFRDKMLQELRELDFSNSKSSAYIFTSRAYHFIDETNRDRYGDIVKSLEIYKYKKSVPKLDEDVTLKIREFVDGL
jgi:hypothetical protein